MTSAEIEGLLEALQAHAICVNVTGNFHLCRDPDDDLILETAIMGEAHYAVSRDGDLKGDSDLIEQMESHGVKVLSVQQFLKILSK